MKNTVLGLKILFILFSGTLFGQQGIFGPNDCLILSENNETVSYIDTTYKGKPCLKLDGSTQAIALLKKNKLKNFRLEMDIATEVMAGLGFQVADVQNYHFLYFRGFYGGTEEAIQYIPVYNGALSWVFYNYPDYESEANFSSLEWFHTTIEVMDNNLKVFINHSDEPKLDVIIDELGTSSNDLLLRSMFGPTYFSNVTIESINNKISTIMPRSEVDFLRKWQISTQYPRDSIQRFDEVFHLAQQADNWTEINDPDDNHINLSKYFEHPNGVVVAKTMLEVLEADKKLLSFDFVGRLQIILNGETVFSFSKLQFDRVQDSTFELLLNLEKGSNELILISEGDAQLFEEGYNSMGRSQHQNWGFIARVIPKK